MKRLALVLALLAAGGDCLAQTARDSLHARTQHVPLDSIQRFVFPVVESYCTTKGASGKMKTACAILARQLRSAWTAESLLIASTSPAPPAPVPAPTPAPTPTPTDTTFTVLASTTFESGAIDAPFWNPYAGVNGGRLTVVDDPTASGRGKVMRIHYENNPSVGWYDDNDAISLPQSSAYQLHFGQSIDFEGDVFWEHLTPTDSVVNSKALRKLIYWGSDSASMIITVQAYDANAGQLFVTNNCTGCAADYQYFDTMAKAHVWHHLHVLLTMESGVAKKDGKETLWWDGAKIYDRSNVTWTNAAWTGDPTTIYFYGFRVGEQLNSGMQVGEDRYWDNLVFKVKR